MAPRPTMFFEPAHAMLPGDTVYQKHDRQCHRNSEGKRRADDNRRSERRTTARGLVQWAAGKARVRVDDSSAVNAGTSAGKKEDRPIALSRPTAPGSATRANSSTARGFDIEGWLSGGAGATSAISSSGPLAGVPSSGARRASEEAARGAHRSSEGIRSALSRPTSFAANSVPGSRPVETIRRSAPQSSSRFTCAAEMVSGGVEVCPVGTDGPRALDCHRRDREGRGAIEAAVVARNISPGLRGLAGVLCGSLDSSFLYEANTDTNQKDLRIGCGEEGQTPKSTFSGESDPAWGSNGSKEQLDNVSQHASRTEATATHQTRTSATTSLGGARHEDTNNHTETTAVPTRRNDRHTSRQHQRHSRSTRRTTSPTRTKLTSSDFEDSHEAKMATVQRRVRYGSTSAQPSQSSSAGRDLKQRPQKQNETRRVWKTAVDPKSGRTYYYDAVTRETQWRKPIELASAEERRAIQEKERKQKDFFAAMEGNILRCMEKGVVPGTPATQGGEEEETVGSMAKVQKKTVKLLAKSNKPSRAVRTISSMNNDVLAEVTKVTGDSPPKVQQGGPSPTSVASLPASMVRKPPQDGLMSHLPRVPVAGTPMPFGTSGEREDRAIAQLRQTANEMASIDICNRLKDDDLINSSHSADVDDSVNNRPLATSSPELPKPKLTNRNTCGTIYMSSTMSAPDKDATIKCVCAVYRAHMLQAAKDEASSGFRPAIKFDEYEVFNDLSEHRRTKRSGVSPLRSSGHRNLFGITSSRSYDHGSVLVSSAAQGIEALSLESIEKAVPSLDEITAFYRDVFRRSQMETDCIIMSLIYVERLIKETNGGVRPRMGNWRSVLFASMVMASKVWDDLSMWNVDFSQTCPAGVRFTLRRINELELAMLSCLKFVVKVPASEYAKYYFLLRSMMVRSGLASEDLSSMSPLDVQGAKKLEVMSSNFQVDSAVKAESDLRNRRSKSFSVAESKMKMGRSPLVTKEKTSTAKVSLEQVVHL